MQSTEVILEAMKEINVKAKTKCTLPFRSDKTITCI